MRTIRTCIFAQILASTYFACSCSTSDKVTKTKDLKEIYIDVNEKPLTADNLVKVHEVAIDSKDEKAPKYYAQIVARNDTLLILDNIMNQGIYAYNMQGRPLFHYNNIGQGEKQCMQMFDMTVGKSCIYINDIGGNKIVKLDMNGNFVEKRNYKRLFPNIYVDEENENIYCDNNNSTAFNLEHSLYIYQRDSITHAYIPIPEELKQLNVSSSKAFWKVGRELHFYTGLRDTIYSVNTNNATPIYHLNFGTAWPSKDFLKSLDNNHRKYRTADMSNYVSYVGFAESKNTLVVSFYYKNTNLIFVYNKSKRKQRLYKFGLYNKFVGMNGDDLIFAEKGKKNDKIEILQIDWKRR